MHYITLAFRINAEILFNNFNEQETACAANGQKMTNAIEFWRKEEKNDVVHA